MKKTIAVLSAFLLFVGTCAVAEQPVHLLWEIPFGMDLDELRPLLFEKSGLTLDEENRVSPDSDHWFSPDDQAFTFLGYPAQFRAIFHDRDQSLKQLAVLIYIDSDAQTGEEADFDALIARMLNAYADILSWATIAYGPPTGGILCADIQEPREVWGEVVDAVIESFRYDYPQRENGTLDLDAAFQVLKAYGSGDVYTYFSNITIECQLLHYPSHGVASTIIRIEYDDGPAIAQSTPSHFTFLGSDGPYGANNPAITPSTAPVSVAAPQSEIQLFDWAELTKSSVNFRETPGSTGAVIAKLAKGTRVQILGIETIDDYAWYQVDYNGVKGYLREDMAAPLGDAQADKN